MFLKMLTPSGRLGPVEGTGSLILSSVCHLGWTGRRSQPSSGFLKLSSELVWEEQGWPHCASSLVKGRNGAHDAGSNSITLVTCVDTTGAGSHIILAAAPAGGDNHPHYLNEKTKLRKGN